MGQPITRALLSVSDKTGIVEFAHGLQARGIEIISTGGTAGTLRDNGLEVTDVSEVTHFPEIMDGRVKTLHPAIHGGLLGRPEIAHHKEAMEAHNIQPIGLVAVNLYPFEATVARGADAETCIENIDIGGPAMIRAAAKNHENVVVVVNPSHYSSILEKLKSADNQIDKPIRVQLAQEAFGLTSAYDTSITQWMVGRASDEILPTHLTISLPQTTTLRYGENPHQKAALYASPLAEPSAAHAEKLQGKELSYNNLSDTDAALELVSEFTDGPACAIIKHANPCGVAVGSDVVEAYHKALSCDPVSAYGGILAFNRPFTAAMAKTLGKHFAEVIIAPDYEEEALALLSAKKNLRVLRTHEMPDPYRKRSVLKPITGGLLLQERDSIVLDEKALKIVTRRAPTEVEMHDLRFAFTVCKHVKSNAIIYAKEGATIGIGAGQMSRVDSSRIGSWKAKETCTSAKDAHGSVLASDAFFPFADGLENAAQEGVTAVIQPGGSIRDDEVIKAANSHNIAMVFTGIRHFRH